MRFRRQPGAARRHPPRGVTIIAWLLLLIAIIGLIAIALNAANICQRHGELQAVCDAAALAGTAELMDPRPPCVRNAGPDSSQSGETRSSPVHQRVEAARQAASSFALQNSVGSQPVVLDFNRANASDGDIVVAWIDDPAPPGSPLERWVGEGPVNSMLVRVRLPDNAGTPVTAWFGRLFGVDSFDLGAAARATVDQRVYGFRPAGHVRAPLMPAVVLVPPGEDVGWGSAGIGHLGRQDRFAVDNRREKVSPSADGIPEFSIRFRRSRGNAQSPSSPGGRELCLLSLAGGAADVSRLTSRAILGLDHRDLAGFGGQFAFDEDGQLFVDVLPLTNASASAPLRKAMLAARGKARIWPMGRLVDRGRGEPACKIIGFAAACVVDCQARSHSDVELVVQPCVMQTCTALVDPRAQRNPWIGKLVLSL